MMAKDTQLAELDGGPLTHECSVFRYFEQGCQKAPDTPAVIALHQPPGYLSELTGAALTTGEESANHCVWSHRQLMEAATKLSLGLFAAGVKPGCTIVMICTNRAEWALFFYASAILQATFIALDLGVLGSPGAREAEFLQYMRTLKPNVIAVEDRTRGQVVDSFMSQLDNNAPLKIVIDADDRKNERCGWQTLVEVAQLANHGASAEAALETARQSDPDRTCLILFTSGTSSGRPKGCPMTVRNFIHSKEAQRTSWGMEKEARFLFVSANFRAIAPALTASAWAAGGAIVMPGPAFTPKSALDAIEQASITNILIVPAQLHALVADESFSSRQLTSPRLAGFGADMITRSILQKAAKAFPNAEVMVAHGMSEGGGQFEWSPLCGFTADTLPYYGEIAPVGTAAPGSRIRIVDFDTGSTVKRNEVGELQFCSGAMITHYLGDVHGDSFYKDEEGSLWFRTGDQAMINNDGFVYILGRYSQRFKKAGISVVPAALEACLERYLGTEASIVPVPHAILGHEPYAVVRSFGDKTEAQVKNQIVDTFGKDQALGGAASLEQIGLDDFPLNATSKVMKNELVEHVLRFLSEQA